MITTSLHHLGLLVLWSKTFQINLRICGGTNWIQSSLTVVVMLRIKIHCMACLTSLMLFLFFISNNLFAVQYPLNKRQHSQGKSHWLLSISATHFKIYAQRDEVPGVRASNNKIIALTPFD